MPTQIAKIDILSSIFSGISDICIADVPADYAVATIATLTNWKSLNDVKLDSTSFTGDAPTETQVKNEKGSVVVSTAVAGTNKFEFICYNTSAAMLLKFLGARTKAATFATGDVVATGSTVVGIGKALPIVTCPIMVANDVANQAVLFPMAKIVSTIILDSKVLAVKCTVTAQNIDTIAFDTAMIIRGALNVATA